MQPCDNSLHGIMRWHALLRRTAPRCVLSSLLELAPLEFLAACTQTSRRDFHTGAEDVECVPYCRGAITKWEAKFFKKMMRRLVHLKGEFARSGTAPENGAARERAGYLLAAFLALSYTPTASCFGRWDLAASEAADFVKQVDDTSPNGASLRPTPSGTSAYLRTLAVPLLWALVFSHPVVQKEQTDE